MIFKYWNPAKLKRKRIFSMMITIYKAFCQRKKVRYQPYNLNFNIILESLEIRKDLTVWTILLYPFVRVNIHYRRIKIRTKKFQSNFKRSFKKFRSVYQNKIIDSTEKQVNFMLKISLFLSRSSKNRTIQ